MAAYVKNAHGDWNNPSVWTPNGIPIDTDTVTFGPYVTTIPDGYTAKCGGGTGTGTNTTTRCTLVIAGTLELYGNIQMEDWTTLSFTGTGTLDLRANSFIFNNNGSSGKRNELISDGTGLMRIRSSTTIGHFGGTAGGQAYAKVSIDNFLIENTTFRCMSSWYPEHGVSVQNGVFYNCGRIETDSYVDDADDWILENVDFRGSQAVEDQKAWIYCRDKGGTITGIRRFKNITFDYHGLANASLRVQFWPAILDVDTVAIRGCYIEAISPVLPTWYRLFSSKAGTIGEALPSIRDAVFSSTGDNPHALQNLLTDLQYFYLETQQPAGSSDAGDHFILPNGGTSLIRYGIINDNWGGVCMNAIGASVTGTHTMEHCTIVADVHDAVYGIIARNENFGVFNPSANVTIRSNIAFARSNVSGSSNVRAINLETAGNDQIDILDNNLITGFGSLLSTIYHGVTYSSGGAVGTAVNRGLNDILNVDPQFVDETRNVQLWATQYGATDYDSAIIYVIDGVNGYNRATQNQDGVLGHTITEMLAYLREGYSPTNAAIATAAHDGTPIGSQSLFLLPGPAFQSDAFQSDTFQSDGGGTTSVNNSLNLEWSTRNIIASNSDLEWAIRALTGQNNNIEWAIRNSISSNLNLDWALRQQLTNNLNLDWSTRSFVNSNLTMDWLLRSLTTSNLNIDYEIRNLVSSNANLEWSLRALTESSLNLEWSLLNLVNHNLNLLWALQGESVVKDLSLQWAVLNSVEANLNLQASVLNSVSGNLSVEYQIVNLIFANLNLEFAIREAIANNLNLSSSILNLVSASSNLEWGLVNLIQSNLGLEWSLRNSIFSNLNLEWDLIAERVSASLNLEWSLRNIILNSLDLNWKTVNLALHNLNLSWSIVPLISQNLNLEWSTSGNTISNLNVEWSTQNISTSNFNINWSVLNTVINEIDLSYAIRQQISLDKSFAWGIIGSSFKNIQLRWGIESLTSFPTISKPLNFRQLNNSYQIKDVTVKYDIN